MTNAGYGRKSGRSQAARSRRFEVRVGGRPVNPLAARMQSAAAISGPELKAFKARLNELMAIGGARA